ncbi:hypothetical protein [Rhodoferax sp.]|uniref:hypothetical protein n=1 Tax=Rhodoferax sp. TaxID=50421 RepID=UPI00261CE012|nr:hypothetical protein [Rhodoferax sp.]MDD2925755.1 hypothetical protein [Rhodoferax sp.]
MAWLTVLKMVPWGEVIENAPKVAQGAKKLWSTVGKKTPLATSPGHVGAEPDEADGALASLRAQVAQLQVASAELHQQMLESSALIQSLAEQNTQLIQRVEVNRKRLWWLALAWIGLAAVLVYKLF